MIDQKLSDDEMIAEERRSYRAQARLLSLTFALFVAMGAVFFGGTALHLPSGPIGGVALALLLLWVVSVFRNPSFIPPPEAYLNENILRKMIDDHHRRWRWMFALFFGLLAMLAGELTLVFLHASKATFPFGGDARFGFTLFAAVFAFVALLTVLQVCFGPGFVSSTYRKALNDELTRAHQRRTAMFGYILAVMAMSAVLMVAMYKPQWGIAALPGVIAAVIALPGFYFLILEWRADRNG